MQNEELEYIRSTWSDFIGSVNRFVGSDCEAEVRKWLCDTAVTVWATDTAPSEEQAAAVAFMSGSAVTADSMRKAFGADADKLCEIPPFFARGCANSALVDKTVAWDIADVLKIYLEYILTAGGAISLSQQKLVDTLHKTLEEYCDRNIVIGTSPAMFFDPALFDLAAPDVSDGGNILSRSLKLSTEIKLGARHDEKPAEKEQTQTEAEAEAEAEEDTDTIESVMEELNGLVGLDKVKEDVQSLMNFIRVSKLRKERGMKVPTVSYHLVFTGNPGTGKTTVARMIARLYKVMGILPKGQLVETDRSGLVAGYLGQTAIKTQEVIDKAMGGVLFVDEAYALANDKEDSFGKEAIETILKAMEDHRDELVVIVAGYDDLMHKFIDSNPGLSSRFNKYFNFPDYDGEALLKILQRFCDSNGYTLAEDMLPVLREKFDEMYDTREKHFGNARTIRNLFEHAINDQANRLATDEDITDEELTQLTAEDINSALESLKNSL